MVIILIGKIISSLISLLTKLSNLCIGSLSVVLYFQGTFYSHPCPFLYGVFTVSHGCKESSP